METEISSAKCKSASTGLALWGLGQGNKHSWSGKSPPFQGKETLPCWVWSPKLRGIQLFHNVDHVSGHVNALPSPAAHGLAPPTPTGVNGNHRCLAWLKIRLLGLGEGLYHAAQSHSELPLGWLGSTPALTQGCADLEQSSPR